MIHKPPNIKYHKYYVYNSVCVISANGLLPVPFISPVAYTYEAVYIHQNHNPANTTAVTYGTKINKKWSFTHIAAVFITATANYIFLYMHINAIIANPHIPYITYVKY